MIGLVSLAERQVEDSPERPELIATRASNRICSDQPVAGAPTTYKVFVPAGATVTVSGTADIVATMTPYDAAFKVTIGGAVIVNTMFGDYWGPPVLNHPFSGSWTNSGAAGDKSLVVSHYAGGAIWLRFSTSVSGSAGPIDPCKSLDKWETLGDNCGAKYAGAVQEQAADPVNTATGNFHMPFGDLAAPGRGPGLNLSHAYNSLRAGTNGPLGYGWSHSYAMDLAVGPSGKVTIRQESGAEVYFYPDGVGGYEAPARVVASLVHNSDGTWTFERCNRHTLQFSSAGQLVSISDRNGYATTLAYTAGKLATITDAAGRTLTVTWLGARIESVSDGSVPARTVSFIYDAAGDLTVYTDPAAGTWRFTYDPSHRLLTMRRPRHATNPTPPVTTNVYDASDRVVTQTDELNRATAFDYTTIPGATKVTDPKGNVAVIGYQNLVRTYITRGWGTSAAATWTYETDPYSLGVTKVTDPVGAVSTALLDPNGNVVKATDPLGRVTLARYNELDQPYRVEDAMHVVTTATYDTAGNLRTLSTPVGGQTRAITLNYDPARAGDVSSMVDPAGKTWIYTYDTYGNRTSTRDPLGRTTKAGYDAQTGWLLRAVSPRGVAAGVTTSCVAPALGCSAFTYNKLGQIVTATDPLGKITERGYDANGNVTFVEDAKDQRSELTYDAADQPTTLRRPDLSTLTTAYWPDASVKETRDGAGRATAYSYDSRGRLASVTDPAGRTTTYGYDPAGDVVTKADPGGTCPAWSSTTWPPAMASTAKCTAYGYNAAGRLTSVTYSDGTTPNVTGITYDANGNRLSMTDGSGASSYVWDALGRMTSSTNAGQTLTYGYDLRGLPTTTTYPGTPQLVVTRTYDDAGNPLSVASSRGGTALPTTTYTTDDDAAIKSATTQLTGITQADSSVYDNAGRLTSSTFTKKVGAGTPTTLGSMSFGLDAKGMLSSQSDTGLPTTMAHSYDYNALDQLKTADAKTYGYDAADNVTKLANGASQGFDVANQLCFQSFAGATGTCAAPPAGSFVPSYDERGNRTAMGAAGLSGMSLSWDQANRLKSTQPSAQSGNQGEFTAIAPVRAMETRTGYGTCPPTTCATLGAGQTLTLKVTGVGQVPTTGVAAVAMHITSDAETAQSFLTAYGTGDPQPAVATLGWTPGKSGDNLAIVKVGSDGTVKLYNHAGSVNLVVDIQGWFSASSGGDGSGFTAKNPERVFDTRPGSRMGTCPVTGCVTMVGAGTTLKVKIAGQVGVPATGVSAVALNLGAVNSTASEGDLVVWSGDGPAPPATALHYDPSRSTTKLVTVKLSATGDGTISIANWGYGTLDLIGEIQGWYASGSSQFQPLNPKRITVTSASGRTGVCPNGCQPIASGTTLQVQVTGQGGIPNTGVSAVALNVHATSTAAGGYMTIWPSDAPISGTAPLYLDPVQGATNLVMAKLAADGMVSIYNGSAGTVDVDLEVQGFFLQPTPTVFYTYDGGGLRMTKAVSGGATSNFVWDRSQGLAQLVSDGTYSFVYGPDGLPIYQVNAAGAVTYLHHDRIGTTRQLTDNGGNVVGTATYDPYGNIFYRTGSVSSPLGYAGEYTDAETGFVYLRARYYDPSTAQFLSRDPLESATGEPYGYVGGNPLNAIDPSGLMLQEIIGTGVDVWDTFRTFSNPCSSGADKLASAAFLAAGIALPGSGRMYKGLLDGIAPRAADDAVSVFHGSIDDAGSIARNGLDPARTPTWASRDLRAAEDAIGPNRIDVMRDPGIIESRIPRADFDKMFASSERAYSGFNGGLGRSSEIVLRTREQVSLFNRHMVGRL